MNLPPMHWDRQGKPISWQQAKAYFRDDSYVRVARTELPNGIEVSTVWLYCVPIHSIVDGKPLIFESLVFGVAEEERDQDRYHTEEEARAGHAALVAKWSARGAGS